MGWILIQSNLSMNNILVDLCILNKLGWIDTEGQAVDGVMTADLMTLPTEVSAKLSDEKVDACADKMVSKMSQRHKR